MESPSRHAEACPNPWRSRPARWLIARSRTRAPEFLIVDLATACAAGLNSQPLTPVMRMSVEYRAPMHRVVPHGCPCHTVGQRPCAQPSANAGISAENHDLRRSKRGTRAVACYLYERSLYGHGVRHPTRASCPRCRWRVRSTVVFAFRIIALGVMPSTAPRQADRRPRCSAKYGSPTLSVARQSTAHHGPASLRSTDCKRWHPFRESLSRTSQYTTTRLTATPTLKEC